MKVLLYVNPEKDKKGEYSLLIEKLLIKHGVIYEKTFNETEINASGFSAIISVGGDGTILRRTTDAVKFGLPILGINAGKLGFLTEFELSEAESAVKALKDGTLYRDERAVIKLEYDGNFYYALNDVVLSRSYEENGAMTVSIGVKIDNVSLKKTIGDGVLVSTPTGSTGYSLSAGGAILAPGINAFCVTPIASHSLLSRSVVFSSDKTCELTVIEGASAGLYVDGKLISLLKSGESVKVTRSEKNVAFLRRKGFDFFGLLNKKLQDR